MVDTRISLTVPPTPGQDLPTGKGGWTRYGRNYLSKDIAPPQDAEAVVYWTDFPGGGWATLCPGLVGFPAGNSGADLAAAVSSVAGVELVSGPSATTVGKRPARSLVLRVREDLGCDPGYFFTWQFVAGGPFWEQTDVGDTIQVWIVDLEATRLFIAGETTTDATPELGSEIRGIVESIRFD